MSMNKPLAPLSDTAANLAIYEQHQKVFNETYISSSQIAEILGVTTPTMINGRRDMLPPAITIPGVKALVWHREHALPFIEAWKLSLNRRRKP